MVFGEPRKPWARRREAVARDRGAGSNSVWRSCHGVSNLALSQERSLSALAKLPAAPIAAGLIERSRPRAALRNAPGSSAPRGI